MPSRPVPGKALFERGLRAALRPYPPGERYLVGVSGGRDSVALLHGLISAGYGRLVVCHLDHGLRGKAAREDAHWVRRLAGKWELPVEIGRADVAGLAAEGRLSLETAAREARYRFFAEVAGRRRARRLFLAHHANDQVETFLFNLLRGAGPSGLGGMAVETRRTIGRRKLTIIRPLLGVWREDVDSYLLENRLKWREDATNADPAHGTRNRLRAEVIPMLERAMGREVGCAIWRAADILGAEEAWIAQLLLADGPLPEQLAVEAIARWPLGKQRRLLRSWLAGRGVKGVGHEEVESVRSLLDLENGPAKVNLPGGLFARRRGGKLWVE